MKKTSTALHSDISETRALAKTSPQNTSGMINNSVKKASPLRLLLLWTCLAFAAVATPLSAQINLSVPDTTLQHVDDFKAQDRTIKVSAPAGEEWVWSSDSNWLKSDEAGTLTGTGNPENFKYVLAQNGSDENRDGIITFFRRTGGITGTLRVKQTSQGETFLTIGARRVDVNEDGDDELSVQVSSNTEWSWQSSNPGWLNGLNESNTQNGNAVFDYKVSENITSAPRSAFLTFTAGDITRILEVTQQGQGVSAAFALSDLQQASDATAKSVTVEVIATDDTTWIWSRNDTPWLSSQEPATQTGSQTFTYQVAANETFEPRSGSLTFSTTSGGFVLTLEVTQERAFDSDGDGEADPIDEDNDNDGTPDDEDAFPFDPNEDTDTDGDGIGNNADPDDDNDGILDAVDPYPLDVDRVDSALRTVNIGGQTLYIPWDDVVDVRRGISALTFDGGIIDYINGVISDFPDWGDAGTRSDYLTKLGKVLELVSAAEGQQDPDAALILYMMASEIVDDELISGADGLQDIGANKANDRVFDQGAQDGIYRDLIYLSDYLWLKML